MKTSDTHSVLFPDDGLIVDVDADEAELLWKRHLETSAAEPCIVAPEDSESDEAPRIHFGEEA